MDGNLDGLLNTLGDALGDETLKRKTSPAPTTSTSPDWGKLKKGDDFHGFYVTSAFDKGGHNPGSKHYSGKAIDLRVHNKTPQQIEEAIQKFQSMGYKVRDERTRPKGQQKWTAPHLHIENVGQVNRTPQQQKSADLSGLLGNLDSILPPIQSNLNNILPDTPITPQNNSATPGTAEYNQQVVAKGSKLPQIIHPVTEDSPPAKSSFLDNLDSILPPTNETFNNPVAPIETQNDVTQIQANPQIVEPVQTLGTVQPDIPPAVTTPPVVPPVIEQPPTDTPEVLYKQFLTDTGLPDSPESLAEFNLAQKLSVEGANAENIKAAQTDQANMAAYNAERQKELNDYNAQRKPTPPVPQISEAVPPPNESQPITDTTIGIQVKKGESVRDAIRKQAIQAVSGRGYMASDVEAAIDKYGSVSGADGRDDYQAETEDRTVNLTIGAEFFNAVEVAKKDREQRQSALKEIALERLRKGGELGERDLEELASEGVYLKDIPAEELDAARTEGQTTETDRAKRFEGNKYATILRASELGEINAKETADMIAFQDEIEADILKNTKARVSSSGTGRPGGEDTFDNIVESDAELQKRINDKLNEIRSRKKGGIPALYRQREFEKKELEKFKKEYISGGGYNVPAQIAKSFTKGALQVVTDAIQATDIAGETLGIDLYAQTVGDGRVRNAYERDSYKFAEYLNKRIEDEISDDPLLKDKAYLTSLPRTFGGLSVQILAGLATGGAAAPTLLGASQGATGQYKAALEADAEPKHRQIAAAIGGLLAVPEALLFTKWFKGASLLKQRTFFGNMTRQVYLNLRNKGFIQKEAAEIATGVTKGFAQKMGAKGKEFTKDGGFEAFQETILEGKGNDLAAYLTYDSSPERLEKVTSLTGEDLETAVVSFLAGGGGSLVVNQVKDSAEKPDAIKSRIQSLDLSGEVKDTLTEMVDTGIAEKTRKIQDIKPNEVFKKDSIIGQTVSTPKGEGVVTKEVGKNVAVEIEKADGSTSVVQVRKNQVEIINEKNEISEPPAQMDASEDVPVEPLESDVSPEIVKPISEEINLPEKTQVAVKTDIADTQAKATIVESDIKPRSLPKTLRDAGVEANDEFYKVFGNEEARQQADKTFKDFGLEGTIKQLENKTSFDKADAVLSVQTQRALLNEARKAETDGDRERAEELRGKSLEIGSKHARLATEAGQFNQAAAMLATTADGVIYHANKIAADSGKSLSSNAYTKFETLGTQGEQKFNDLEIYQNEIKGLKQRIAELETAKTTSPLERYSISVTRRANSKLPNAEELRKKISARINPKLESQAGTVVIKPAKPFEQTPEDLMQYGASLLIGKPLGKIKRDEFYREMRKAFGRKISDKLPQIFADSINYRNQLLKDVRAEIQAEKLKAEFPDKTDAEIKEIAKEREGEKTKRRATGALAKQLASLYSPVRAREVERQIEIIEDIAETPEVAEYAERILTKTTTAEDLARKNVKTYRSAQKAIEQAKVQRNAERDAIKEEILAGKENLKALEREEYLKRQEAKQTVAELAREYRRLEESPLKFYGKETLKILGETRSILASGDLSGALRQGFYFTITNPVTMFKGSKTEDGEVLINGAFGGLIKSFGKAKHAEMMSQIEKHPNFDVMLKMGIEFGDAGTSFSSLTKAEENIRTEYAKKLPVAKQWLEWSERTYSGFLDLQRALMADSIIKELESQGLDIKNARKEYEAAAKLINVATGRGDLTNNQQLNDAVSSVGRVFFAPRYAISRFQLLGHIFGGAATMPPAMRKIALKRAMRFHTAVSLPLVAAGMMGLVSLDPDDDDFLKIRIGDKARYEATGGLQSYLRLIARMGKGVFDVGTGNIKGSEFKNKLYYANANFLTNKLAPVPSYAVAAFKGTEPDRSEFHWLGSIGKRLAPITFREFYENTSEDGVLGFVATVPTVFGIGLGYYPDRTPENLKKEFRKKVSELREQLKGASKEERIEIKKKLKNLESGLKRSITTEKKKEIEKKKN